MSRDLKKTLSFGATHVTVAFGVGYAMTGSVWVGGALALVEPMVNTVAFHLHEKVWRRLERRGDARAPAPESERGRLLSKAAPV